MTDQFVQLQVDGAGKKVDTTEVLVGANIVERQRVHLAGTEANSLVEPVMNGGVAGLPVINDETSSILNKILKELRIMNIHLEIITGEKISNTTVET